MFKQIVKKTFNALGYELTKVQRVVNVPDFQQPHKYAVTEIEIETLRMDLNVFLRT